MLEGGGHRLVYQEWYRQNSEFPEPLGVYPARSQANLAALLAMAGRAPNPAFPPGDPTAAFVLD